MSPACTGALPTRSVRKAGIGAAGVGARDDETAAIDRTGVLRRSVRNVLSPSLFRATCSSCDWVRRSLRASHAAVPAALTAAAVVRTAKGTIGGARG